MVTGELEPEEENRPRGNFQLGEVYDVTDDGRLGRTHRRRVERQLAQLQAENDYQERLEEEASADELPAEIAEDLEEQHRAHIGLQIAQMDAAARAADAASDAAAAPRNRRRFMCKRRTALFARAQGQAQARRTGFRKRSRRHFPIYRHHRFQG